MRTNLLKLSKPYLKVALPDPPQVDEKIWLTWIWMSFENVAEVRRAGRQDDSVGSDFALLGGQGDIEEIGARPQVLKGQGDVRAVVVPSQAVLFGRTHVVADVKHFREGFRILDW